MALHGFDSPRPAPRLPGQAHQKLNSTKRAKEKRMGMLSADQLDTPPRPPPKSTTTDRNKGPYLNVITNFSKPNQQRGTETRKVVDDGKESIRQRRLKGRNTGSKGRIESLRTEEPASGLSPSDRELMIGITIPGPPAAKQPQLTTNLHAHRKSRTPEIVITPADTQSPWNSPPQSQIRNRRRVASSVYSQYPDDQLSLSTAPPVPSLVRNSVATSIETSSRCTSWATEFSEDDTLHRDQSRPESGHSQRGILRRNSADTIAPKYRSYGWWNQILSPFLDRTGTMKSMKLPNEEFHQPDDDFKSGNWKIAKPKVRRQSNVHSIWADLTGRNIIPKTEPFFKDDLDSTYNNYPGVHRGQMVLSPGMVSGKSPVVTRSMEPDTSKTRGVNQEAPRGVDFIGVRSPPLAGVQGMGLAAEYFEAYWHDQNSPTPYFKCQNHKCIWGVNSGANFRTTSLADKSLEANDRGLAGTEAGSTLKPTDEGAGETGAIERGLVGEGLKDVPARGAPSHSHHDSGDTEFEDDLEDPPVVSRARAVLPVRGASTIVLNATRELPEVGDRQLPYPPDSAKDKGVISPGAMTPGLRSHFNEHRALPLEPTERKPTEPEPEPEAFEPMPRYPPMGEPADAVRSMPAEDALPLPPAPDKFPTGRAMYRDQWNNVFTYNLPPDSNTLGKPQMTPLNSNPTIFKEVTQRSEKGLYVEELNDSHPEDFMPPPQLFREPAQARDFAEEEPNKVEKKPSKLGKILKRVFTNRRDKSKDQDRRKRRRLFCCIFFGLFIMTLAIVIPVILITLPRADMSVQTSWLNVSGYPAVPTGIATIVRPNAQTVDGCVEPSTMWSCSLPKELQASIAPNKPDQPNFRVEIRFQNGTNLTSNSTFSKRSVVEKFTVVQFLRRQILGGRDSFTSSLFSPNPAPPSSEDQAFLGNTTDNNTQPVAGEATPFFISFLDATQLSSSPVRVKKRQSLSPSSGNHTNATDPFPNLGNAIPAPDINQDGTAAAANLYPVPSAQPLVLYNRGQPDEHYGFYTYFDRSIFLKSASVDNITTIGVVPDDQNGGALEQEASLRCTWAQTRFLVQIWTNTQGAAQLLSNSTANDPSSTAGLSASSTSSAAAAQTSTTGSSSSANDFAPPGSFPYPVTITMDRHGGDINLKSVYCYGMDDREHVIDSEKKFQLENRAFGGQLVNPAEGLFNQVNVSVADGGPGGIDGGSGGCSCQWQNFRVT